MKLCITCLKSVQNIIEDSTVYSSCALCNVTHDAFASLGLVLAKTVLIYVAAGRREYECTWCIGPIY